MRVAHLLRKLDPAEWSGTETAVHRLLEGLRQHHVDPVVYCPRLDEEQGPDPLVRSGFQVERFKAFVPVLGLSRARKRQLLAVGGNLMSFDLLPSLWREKGLDVIHAHTLGRLGGIGLTVAKQRRLPFVITIHGGAMDLPEKIKESFNAPVDRGVEWGKIFGILLQSHRLFVDADAILTCNPREAALLKEQLPHKRIQVQAHGVPVEIYREPHVDAALTAFPQLRDRTVVLCLGRIDPVKNQEWLLKQAPRFLARHPRAVLTLVGPCTDEAYGRRMQQLIVELGLEGRVLVLGGFSASDPRLLGLLQMATVLVVPSLSETFGLVILEAWAAGTTVLSVRASGPAALVEHGSNGLFFDLEYPETFHEGLERILGNPAEAAEMAERGGRTAEQYSVSALAGQLSELYRQIIEEKQCVT